MLILGIESASDQCGCALAAEDGVLAETRLALPRRHAEALAPQMRFVCEQAGVALADIEAVAVDHGPGLYTGLRAGLATAKATAAALEIGVVPVGSLEALAYGAAAVARPGETVLSVLDARRGEVFWAWYRIAVPAPNPPAPDPPAPDPPAAAPSSATDLSGGSAGGEGDPSSAGYTRLVQLSAPQVGPPTDLLAALSSGDRPTGRTVVVGDGALRHADLLAVDHVVLAGPELRFPSPAAVALLGRRRALAGGTVTPEQVDALYLRSPDAQPQSSAGSPNS
ncbi:MAG: tRNA (adenosine(37)-N6)-threonylcarbamoyltransferase complex dimerization subunit type 1 TsaB [bacterium]|nr:tRNA (adenosine(37)-N6)-threonylcarbamoyltransferase complex dimerization subunit type 1 TsaB [bacterium]